MVVAEAEAETVAADLQSLSGSHLAIDSECGKRTMRNPSRTGKGRQPAAADVAAGVAVAVTVASHAAISEVAGSQRKCACRQHVEMRIEMEMGIEMQMEMHIKMWNGQIKGISGKDKVNAETQRPATESGAFPKMDILFFEC